MKLAYNNFYLMFNKNDEKNGEVIKDAETIIGPSVKVNGQFHGEGNILVEGIVEGSLKTNNNLYIGDKARVTASIEASEARVGGEIKGNINIDNYLEIASSAKITGDITCGQISIAKGASINGKILMGNAKENLKTE